LRKAASKNWVLETVCKLAEEPIKKKLEETRVKGIGSRDEKQLF